MRAPMKTRLPKYIDPARLASKRDSIAGKLMPGEISRLAALYRAEAEVEVDLKFTLASQGRIAVSGSLRTQLSAQCQRCLQPVYLNIAHDIDVVVVDSEAIGGFNKQIPVDGFDDAVEYQSKLNVYELVEDELVLASPIIPQHERGMCAMPKENEATEASTEDGLYQAAAIESGTAGPNTMGDGQQPSPKTTRPFADLAVLLSAKVRSKDE